MSTNWTTTGADCYEKTHNVGSIQIEATVMQGGNNLWTTYIFIRRLGRPFKRNPQRRTMSSSIDYIRHPEFQARTMEEGMAWADEEFNNQISKYERNVTP